MAQLVATAMALCMALLAGFVCAAEVGVIGPVTPQVQAGIILHQQSLINGSVNGQLAPMIVSLTAIANCGKVGKFYYNNGITTPTCCEISDTNPLCYLPVPITPGSWDSNSQGGPGSYTFTVPAYNSLQVMVWGGGGGGAYLWPAGCGCPSTSGNDGSPGSGSSFTPSGGTPIVAGPGGGGMYVREWSGSTISGDPGGSGGPTSGGDAGSSYGDDGITWQGTNYAGAGGTAPNSPIGNGNGGAGSYNQGAWGWGGSGGGGGGYTVKTYNKGDLPAGTNAAVVVGGGGAAGGDNAVPGTYGRVYIGWN